MRTRKHIRLDPDRIQRRRTVRAMVSEYRNVSKKYRQLKEGRQGAASTPSLRLAHDNTMRKLANRLEISGHKEIATLLSQWHSALITARTENAEDAHSTRCWARSLSGRINREVEAIR